MAFKLSIGAYIGVDAKRVEKVIYAVPNKGPTSAPPQHLYVIRIVENARSSNIHAPWQPKSLYYALSIQRYAPFLVWYFCSPAYILQPYPFKKMAEKAPIAFRFGSVCLQQDAPLGTGAYGQVCKAVLGELPCAAKLLHPILVDPNKPRNRELFEQECRFLSEIRHPNIVQYLGMAQDPTTGMSILLMELMDDSLTHFLELSEVHLPYHVQVNINYDIAQALTFLHSNQIVHRDLSSNNVLLIGDGVRAKVADFGMSKLNHGMAPLTMCPGTRAYMSPEALLDPPTYSEKLDCFQAGVLMVQVITRKFPDPSDAMHRVQDSHFPTGWVNVPVPEADRRHKHLSIIPPTHPLLPIAMDCLKDADTQRPPAQQICHLLLALKGTPQYRQSLVSREGEEKERVIHERDQMIQQLQQENDEMERENQDKEEEKQELIRRLDQIQQMRRQVETELRDEIHELRESVTKNIRLIQEKDQLLRQKEREKYELQQDLQEKEQVLHEKDSLICQLQQSLNCTFYTCKVSGPGLQSATANHPTQALVELSDSSGMPCSVQQNVTAELVLISEDTPTSSSISRWPLSVVVVATSPSRYEVSYTAVSQGQHKIHVQVNNREINGSPFTTTVYPDPTQLCHPVRWVTDLNYPYGIAFNSRGGMIITECHRISISDIKGHTSHSFGSHGDSPEQMKFPAGIAVDNADNIYVSSNHKLQKFTGSGELIKCIGRRGSNKSEFNDPRGLTIYNSNVYVCDRHNHRIQVFDLDLNFIRSIGSLGNRKGEFDGPYDVHFDTAGDMYVADYNNGRVQVMNIDGRFIRAFGLEGKLRGPSALHIVDKYVYVSDHSGHCIVVYDTSGQFVTSFGKRGHEKGEFDGPRCIISCSDGFIHVCDHLNNRVQIF